VQYGVDNLPAIQDVATGQFGDGAPDTYVAAPALADWPNVVSAEMHLIARATTATAGFRDAKTYDMGIAGTVGPFNDAYKRHLFENCARLINVSGRREIPQ
jgi:type IV pilus assembly protein PilW